MKRTTQYTLLVVLAVVIIVSVRVKNTFKIRRAFLSCSQCNISTDSSRFIMESLNEGREKVLVGEDFQIYVQLAGT